MNLTRVDEIIDRYDREPSSLVMMLQDVQEAYNYLPEPALKHLAEGCDIPLGRAYNVATFYSSLSLTERGRHVIRVCDGTACHLRGATNIRDELTRQLGITDGQTTEDKMFTLETVACLGACALAPVIMVGSTYHGQIKGNDLREILDGYRNAAADK